MRLALKYLILSAACLIGMSGLSGCGGSNQGNAAAEQSKHLSMSQKSSASSYNQVVEQLYVAYFGRPADPTGLANFSAQLAADDAPTDIQHLLQAYSSNSAVKSLIDSFGTSTESKNLYGTDSAQSFVTAVFHNVLGRDPATQGLTFWENSLNSGSVTYGNVALQIMAGALINNSTQGQIDAQLIGNRIAVATEFTTTVTTDNAVAAYTGASAAQSARTMLTNVSSTTNPAAYQSTVDATVTAMNNVTTITVDSGADPASFTSVDAAFTSVTICAPSNPTLCQTIDHVLVDTGSYGLRLVYSTLSSQMAAALSTQTSGNTLVECTTFVDGYTWGPLRQVNFSIAGESVSNMNMQVIGDPAFSNLVPSECASTGPAENTVDAFGSNGVIGVGLFANDCGNCATQNVGAYFTCSSSSCTDTLVSAAQQVNNPVSQFTRDNNGVVIQLPAVSPSGENTVSGYMIFGVNTLSDNALGSASVFQMDESGNFTTVYSGSSMPNSFIDSGSNGLYFPNQTGISTCSDGFYCPNSTLSLSAIMQGVANKVSGVANTQTIPFTIGYADNVTGSVSVDFGAPNSDSTSFDWGLPFFFGRNVYVVQDGKTANGQTGPFVAF